MASRIYIGDTQAELDPGTVVPITRQANTIANIENRQMDYSARIRLPMTNVNRELLGFTDGTNSNRDKAYESPAASVLSSGVPVIENGTGRVLDTNQYIEFMVNGPGWSFWNDIEELDIYDIDWSDLDFDLTVADVYAMAGNTSGIIWPGIDYGGISGNNLDIRYSFPAVYLHTIISRIISDQGYTATGDILTDELYLKAALPFSSSRWEHSQRFIEMNGFDKSITQTYTANDTSTFTVSNKVYGSMLNYTATNSITTDIAFTYNVTTITKNLQPGNVIDLKFALRINGVIQNTHPIVNIGTGTFSVSSVAITAGDLVDIAVVADFSFVSGIPSYYMEVQSGNFYTPEISKTVVLGDTITAETILPKMGQKELLKAFMQLFGQIPIVNETTKTIAFHSFNEIYDNIPSALDWSEKLVKPPDTLSHVWYTNKKTRIGDYGQKNYAEFAADDTLGNSEVGRGFIPIADTSLKRSYTMFTLPWAACESVTKFITVPTRIAQIRFFEDDGSGLAQKQNPRQRICYIDFTGTLAFSYTDGTTTQSVTNSPVGRFIEPSNAINLGFDNSVLSRYYNGLRKLLDRAQKLTVLCNLGPADVAGLDFLVPVYFSQLGAYYYVESIQNYIENELTKIEIIKL